MTETTAPKQSIVATVKNGVQKHQTKILIATSVLSTTAAIAMRSNVSQMNTFLKEHDLFDAYYEIATTVES